MSIELLACILLGILVFLIFCLVQTLSRIERHFQDFKYDFKRLNADKYYRD